MDVLSSRILIRPSSAARSHAFYRDVLGLAVHREFSVGVVYFLGNGLLEVSGDGGDAAPGSLALWLQVRDVAAEYERVTGAGAVPLREPRLEPWGLIEAQIADPDGLRIHLVEIPQNHPLRLDQR